VGPRSAGGAQGPDAGKDGTGRSDVIRWGRLKMHAGI